jgi:hypothetical protein
VPYRINKLKKACTQADGDDGHWSVTYTDKKGKKHRICHTSKKNAQGQIAAIERQKNDVHQPGDARNAELIESVIKSILEMNNG